MKYNKNEYKLRNYMAKIKVSDVRLCTEYCTSLYEEYGKLFITVWPVYVLSSFMPEVMLSVLFILKQEDKPLSNAYMIKTAGFADGCKQLKKMFQT